MENAMDQSPRFGEGSVRQVHARREPAGRSKPNGTVGSVCSVRLVEFHVAQVAFVRCRSGGGYLQVTDWVLFRRFGAQAQVDETGNAVVADAGGSEQGNAKLARVEQPRQSRCGVAKS